MKKEKLKNTWRIIQSCMDDTMTTSIVKSHNKSLKYSSDAIHLNSLIQHVADKKRKIAQS